MSSAQKRLIPEFLWHDAEAYGFRGDVWTCARVAWVIAEEFGVRYHKDHVGRLLRELHWTPQVPIRRAIQRDEVAIQRWRTQVWPELRRQARNERRRLVFEDESGFYLLPGVVRTYAPAAQTPVLPERQTRDHLSAMGGMTPEGQVYTLARQESLNGLHSIAFLLHLLRVAGERLLVIWDGSPPESCAAAARPGSRDSYNPCPRPNAKVVAGPDRAVTECARHPSRSRSASIRGPGPR